VEGGGGLWEGVGVMGSGSVVLKGRKG